jgi:hypothetical protein
MITDGRPQLTDGELQQEPACTANALAPRGATKDLVVVPAGFEPATFRV